MGSGPVGIRAVWRDRQALLVESDVRWCVGVSLCHTAWVKKWGGPWVGLAVLLCCLLSFI